MAVNFKCPECKVKFRWNYGKLGWPRFCPECGFENELPEREGVVAPYVSTGKQRGPDQMYREMEAGGQFRTDLTGENMKVTNLRDDIREGEIAEMPVANEVSNLVEANPGVVGNVAREQGLAYSGMVSQGMFPNSGARTQQVLREVHGQAKAGLTSDMPAAELSSPLYQRRV